MNVRVNRWLDFLDRVGWTAVYAVAAAGITALSTPALTWEAGLKLVGTATLLAVLKVIVAQNTGSDDLGAAVPGQVLGTTARPEAVK